MPPRIHRTNNTRLKNVPGIHLIVGQKKMAAASRRSFLKALLAIASVAIFFGRAGVAQAAETQPLMAYVGTFSSPLKDVLPTQVDRPPGYGRGIHLFVVDRETGAMTPAGIQEI